METSRNKIDKYIGLKYGKLTVLEFSHYQQYTKTKQPQFKCLCDCGQEGVFGIWQLKSGKTKSCGCYAKEVNRLSEGESSFNKLFNGYINNAKTRGYNFDLSKEEFKTIIVKDCYYCGKEPSNIASTGYSTGTFTYNGVDRLDNNLGYFVVNCVPCCKTCNIAKQDMSLLEFKEWVSRLYSALNL